MYPSAMTLCGITYDVVLTDKFIESEANPEKKYHGVCLPRHKEIRLYNNPRAPGAVEETFFHELLEMLNFEFDLKLPHQTIKTLGMGYHQMFRQCAPLLLPSVN